MNNWQHRTPDQALVGWLILAGFMLPVAAWLLAVAGLYSFPKGMFWAVWGAAFTATPKVWALWLPPLAILVTWIPAAIWLYAYFRTNFEGPRFQKRFAGPAMMSAKRLSARTKEDGPQLRFCDIPVPSLVESTHFMSGGSTGSGKSVQIAGYIASIQERAAITNIPERIICIDPDGGYMSRFYQPGDVVLNPFDNRGQGWSIFNEIRTEFDCEQFAVSLIPRSASTDQEQWNAMARTIARESLLVLKKHNMATTKHLVQMLCMDSNDELKVRLAETPAAGVFHGAEETLGSIRAVLTQYITPHKYLKPGEFSIRKWLEKSRGNMWVTWSQDMLQALKPLVSCWTDTIAVSILSISDNEQRRMHLIADELDSLEKLNYMIDAATKGRKKGLRLHVGFQSLAQLDHTYGKSEAMTLRNSFRSICLLGVGGLDTYSAQGFSEALGKHIVSREHISYGEGRKTRSYSRDEEFIVGPSVFNVLPPNTGFMKFSGEQPVVKFNLHPKSMPTIVPPVILAPDFVAPLNKSRAAAAARSV